MKRSQTKSPLLSGVTPPKKLKVQDSPELQSPESQFQRTHGVQRIAIHAKGDSALRDRLIIDTEKRLASEGKRVVGKIFSFSDGIALHWVFDRSITSERSNYEIPGLHYDQPPSPRTRPVNQSSKDPPKHVPRGTCSNGDDLRDAIAIDSDDDSNQLLNRSSYGSKCLSLGGHKSTPIVIDDTENDSGLRSLPMGSKARHRPTPPSTTALDSRSPSVHEQFASPLRDVWPNWLSRANDSIEYRRSVFLEEPSTSPPCTSLSTPSLTESTRVDREGGEPPSVESLYGDVIRHTGSYDNDDSGIDTSSDDERPLTGAFSVAHAHAASDPKEDARVAQLAGKMNEQEQLMASGYVTPPVNARPPARSGQSLSVSGIPKNSGRRLNTSHTPTQASPCSVVSIPLPKTKHGRARRVLVPSTAALPIATISMRADAQFIDRDKKFRKTLYSLPPVGEERHVEDACIVDDTVVIGYRSGPCRVSTIQFQVDKKPQAMDLRYRAHNEQNRVESKGYRTGITSLTSALEDRLRFFTGSQDGHLYLWTVLNEDNHVDVEKLDLVHHSQVHALAYRPYDHTLISSAAKRICSMDIQKMILSNTGRLSSDLYHIHIHPHNPNISVLEVAEMDHQIHVYDTRERWFNRKPCIRFGYRYSDTRPPPRYGRGSLNNFTYFVRGYPDGQVILWDYRNSKDPVIKFQHQREPVVHSVFCGSDVIAFGENVVTFFSTV